jgi:hypothetical protein
MKTLQEQLEFFMDKMSNDNVNNVIGVYFKDEVDLRLNVRALKQFFIDNNFSKVDSENNSFAICPKCKISFLVPKSHMIGNEFNYIVYDSGIGARLVDYIIAPSFVGYTTRHCVCMSLHLKWDNSIHKIIAGVRGE